ncbi:endonuclease domain-containing protein [Novosphingobium piscinae]|uniref:DUF559 domain-containing protein n=1 Tax=Novosphingobium piscinae TaxID=1507448 RepID=A0A7X1KPP7_9SPHN|nr:DUF559 domain-containing protein [Novosphingobium piscinae]MBC2668683.1 DUF559 domain-containing protein [Novosphingobium piscinae]
MENHTPRALGAARKLRRQMSLPEGLLWQQLRQRPCGLKFRSQHPVGDFVVDFYCASHRLVIEIDGKVHDMGGNPARDRERDQWLEGKGLTLVRVPAPDVLRDPARVAESLVALCHDMPPPSALRAATSPRGGDSLGVVS